MSINLHNSNSNILKSNPMTKAEPEERVKKLDVDFADITRTICLMTCSITLGK